MVLFWPSVLLLQCNDISISCVLSVARDLYLAVFMCSYGSVYIRETLIMMQLHACNAVIVSNLLIP